jgi:hypothetical protein
MFAKNMVKTLDLRAYDYVVHHAAGPDLKRESAAK